MEIIEVELQKLVRHGLDGVQVFHTFFHRQVAPLVERTRSMWMYTGPMDPDRASPEELMNDEVWSHLDRVLQQRAKETLDRKPEPLHATKLSNLVCSPLHTLSSFPLLLSCILTSSHPFCRNSEFTSLGRIFHKGRRAWLSKPP